MVDVEDFMVQVCYFLFMDIEDVEGSIGASSKFSCILMVFLGNGIEVFNGLVIEFFEPVLDDFLFGL